MRGYPGYLVKAACALLAFVACCLLVPGVVLAAGKPARVITIAVGAYIVDVDLDQDQPYVERPLTLTVVPHNSALRLHGRIIAEPGLGTDATNLYAKLSPQANSAVLVGTISLPVRGAWNLVIELTGPQGQARAGFPVTVAAPGAMPFWMGWVIALTPLIAIAWWLLWLHRYRRSLAARQRG
jgi:hypothetical protein